jgi:hypothetical protein
VQFVGVKRPERRRWKRHTFNVPVRLTTDSAVLDGRGIRMSEGGIYFFSASNLELGSKIKVDFPGDGPGQSPARSGIVRYRALYLYGVEFLHSAESAKALSAYSS